MSGAIKILPYYTYEDYIQWEGRWELIDGIPYAMSPAPTPKHQFIANTLGALFYIALKNCNHCKAYQFIDFKITEDTIVQPDIAILCRPANKKFIDFPPSLIVEILSPSTSLKDRHTKSSLYKKQNVPYYIMISSETEETEIQVLEDGEYVIKQKGVNFMFDFEFDDDCKATIDFGEIWK